MPRFGFITHRQQGSISGIEIAFAFISSSPRCFLFATPVGGSMSRISLALLSIVTLAACGEAGQPLAPT
ncbi:MAG TPA: hypothetical protein VFS20_21225, partial [Longimicrobium sp.]|nr:hypothetical protein [Longimicrobium sp.]